jgi:hypothetical protein
MALPEWKGPALIGTGLVNRAQRFPEHTLKIGLLGERQTPFPEYGDKPGIFLNKCFFVLLEKLCYTGNIFFGEVDKAGGSRATVSTFDTFEVKP